MFNRKFLSLFERFIRKILSRVLQLQLASLSMQAEKNSLHNSIIEIVITSLSSIDMDDRILVSTWPTLALLGNRLCS